MTGIPCWRPSFSILGLRRGVAQLEEHRSPKPSVAGSSPVTPARCTFRGHPRSPRACRKGMETHSIWFEPRWWNGRHAVLRGQCSFGRVSSNLTLGTTTPISRRRGQVVRQRSAKPLSPVRFRPATPHKSVRCTGDASVAKKTPRPMAGAFVYAECGWLCGSAGVP